MCGEKRPVYSWTGDLWRYRGLAISRPEPGVVIVECGGGAGIFNPTDFPLMLPETAEKLKEKEQREKERKQQRDEKRKTKKGQDKQAKDTRTPRKRKFDREPKVKVEPDLLVGKDKEIREIFNIGSQDPNPLLLSPLQPPLI